MSAYKFRFQVSGPHPGGDYARWTVIDTWRNNTSVDVHRQKASAVESAREMNEEFHNLRKPGPS